MIKLYHLGPLYVIKKWEPGTHFHDQKHLLPDRNLDSNADNTQQTTTDVDEQDPAWLDMQRTTTNTQKQIRPDLSIGII